MVNPAAYKKAISEQQAPPMTFAAASNRSKQCEEYKSGLQAVPLPQAHRAAHHPQAAQALQHATPVLSDGSRSTQGPGRLPRWPKTSTKIDQNQGLQPQNPNDETESDPNHFHSRSERAKPQPIAGILKGVHNATDDHATNHSPFLI